MANQLVQNWIFTLPLPFSSYPNDYFYYQVKIKISFTHMLWINVDYLLQSDYK